MTFLFSIFGNYVEWQQYTANGDSDFALNSLCKKIGICHNSRPGHPEAWAALKPCQIIKN